ncbi:peptidylprolyl isomerase [Thioalkalivibrio sp. ALE11]|uniref:peptidylprolyl isomerase n=1 Tax=Thioalkalivibrio sp. ALE11 TaxID=1265494 RepID=UPI0018CAD5CE|nr:peptidylprolyl isomerase [Thioalkalivibrio sp. ALE11]
MIGQLYTIRAAAQEAESTLDPNAAAIEWEVDYQRDRTLMRALIREKADRAAKEADWEELANEHYNANREDYQVEEQVRVSHVLIGVDDREESEAKSLAEKVKDRAIAGEDFSALALEYSDDSSVERNEGALGRFGRGRMAPEFEDAAFAMTNPGEIAGPVETQFGYHIIKFHERYEAGYKPFDTVKDSIIRELKQRQSRDIRESIIRRARAGDDIVVNDDAVANLEEEFRAGFPETGRGQPTRADQTAVD